MSALNESIVEEAAMTWFGELGYAIGHGRNMAPCEPAAERDSFSDVVLVGRLREAIHRLNPAMPQEARNEALRKVLRVAMTTLVQTNRAFHRMLRDGVDVEYHNRAISTMEVIEELIKLAKEMDAVTKRGAALGLTDDEVAFYDALAANQSAVQAMGDDKLKLIAAELIT